MYVSSLYRLRYLLVVISHISIAADKCPPRPNHEEIGSYRSVSQCSHRSASQHSQPSLSEYSHRSRHREERRPLDRPPTRRGGIIRYYADTNPADYNHFLAHQQRTETHSPHVRCQPWRWEPAMDAPERKLWEIFEGTTADTENRERLLRACGRHVPSPHAAVIIWNPNYGQLQRHPHDVCEEKQ